MSESSVAVPKAIDPYSNTMPASRCATASAARCASCSDGTASADITAAPTRLKARTTVRAITPLALL